MYGANQQRSMAVSHGHAAEPQPHDPGEPWNHSGCARQYGCSSWTWFGTTSRITRTPRACASASSSRRSASVPRLGSIAVAEVVQ